MWLKCSWLCEKYNLLPLLMLSKSVKCNDYFNWSKFVCTGEWLKKKQLTVVRCYSIVYETLKAFLQLFGVFIAFKKNFAWLIHREGLVYKSILIGLSVCVKLVESNKQIDILFVCRAYHWCVPVRCFIYYSISHNFSFFLCNSYCSSLMTPSSLYWCLFYFSI